MPEVGITSDVDFGHENPLRAVAVVALELLQRPEAELSILITSDDAIRPLNRTWRGKDSATDVLSFPQSEGEPLPETTLLGDIVISLDTAASQAQQAGHSTFEECVVLLVHGLLHLLGYDHIDADDAQQMRIEESRILAAVSETVSQGLISRASHP